MRANIINIEWSARLIEQIRADARASLLDDLSAKDGIAVLRPLDAAPKPPTPLYERTPVLRAPTSRSLRGVGAA
jgi:hypothetical protein